MTLRRWLIFKEIDYILNIALSFLNSIKKKNHKKSYNGQLNSFFFFVNNT